MGRSVRSKDARHATSLHRGAPVRRLTLRTRLPSVVGRTRRAGDRHARRADCRVGRRLSSPRRRAHRRRTLRPGARSAGQLATLFSRPHRLARRPGHRRRPAGASGGPDRLEQTRRRTRSGRLDAHPQGLMDSAQGRRRGRDAGLSRWRPAAPDQPRRRAQRPGLDSPCPTDPGAGQAPAEPGRADPAGRALLAARRPHPGRTRQRQCAQPGRRRPAPPANRAAGR